MTNTFPEPKEKWDCKQVTIHLLEPVIRRYSANILFDRVTGLVLTTVSLNINMR